MKENYSYSKRLKTAGTSEVQKFFLKNLYKIIEVNLDTSVLTVTYLAKNMAVSKSTLNRKLLCITGLSANELIKQYRLKKAIVFLLKGKNVRETAYKTGFKTSSYFIQCFKEFYKVTPKEYTKRLIQN